MYMPHEARATKGNLTRMFYDGIFLGMYGKTGEFLVGTDKGALKVRTIRRRPLDERWSASQLRTIKGTPWCPLGDDTEGPVGVHPRLRR